MSLVEQQVQRPQASTQERPLNVELVGPAGAGKTSVLRAIGRRDESVRLWERFDRLQSLPVIARSASAFAPTALELLRRSPRSTWFCVQHLLRLRAFHTILARAAAPLQRALILGEGPVYSLCRLSLVHKFVLGSMPLPQAWRETLALWPGTLDVVVWLDAPDPVLAHRIRQRSKTHEVKNGTDREIYGFLQQYRDAYRDILAELAAVVPIRVVTIDTAQESVDQTAAGVLALVRELRPRTWPGRSPVRPA